MLDSEVTDTGLQNSYPALQIRARQCSNTANLQHFTAHFYHVIVIVSGSFSKKSSSHEK